jgi:hypothetical protein
MTWCHFSALYVVDLAKFRQTASGDTLRVLYEQLSKDPNSLSNLDQVSDLLMKLFNVCITAWIEPGNDWYCTTNAVYFLFSC